MKSLVHAESGTVQFLPLQEIEKPTSGEMAEAFTELKRGVRVALETYSNVHRGSGHNSVISTHLYEQAREIVLDYLALSKEKYTVIFCTPRRAELLKAQLKPQSYQCLSSDDIGLPLGVRALAVDWKALPRGAPFQTGGGTARLVAPDWVIWANTPDKFEAGTPAIINVIAFAKALRLIGHFGKDAFRASANQQSATEILYHDKLEKYSRRELLNELRQSLIGHDVRVPTTEGTKPYINLDNAASTPTFKPIWDAVWQTWLQPRQVHDEIVHEVRSICADVLSAPLTTYDVIFTSNTTEAINLVAESFRNESEQGSESIVLNTLLEHNSNELPWRMIPGTSLIRIPVDAEGFIDLKKLESLLSAYNQKAQHGKKRIKLVAVSGASNVLGVCNNLTETSQIVHRYDARLLVDAAQLVAHRKIAMEASGIDYLVFSAHKAYAPFGTGALIVRKELLHFSPAELELIQSSGEENVGGIAGLGKALLLLQRIGLDLIQAEEQALTARMLHDLAGIPGLTVYGIKDPDSPQFARKGGVIAFALNDMLATQNAQALAERSGIGIRAGCHCAHLLVKHLLHISPSLARLQRVIVTFFPQLSLPGVARVSLGIENTIEDVDALIAALGNIVQQPQTKIGNPFASTKTDIQKQMDEFARAAAQRVYSN
jgi:selenocysteine lyase/cysteine desulfurase